MVHCLVLVLSCFTREAVRAILVTCRANDIVSTLHNIHVVDIVHPFPTHFDVTLILCVFTFFRVGGKCHIRNSMQDFVRFFVIFHCKIHK